MLQKCRIKTKSQSSENHHPSYQEEIGGHVPSAIINLGMRSTFQSRTRPYLFSSSKVLPNNEKS